MSTIQRLVIFLFCALIAYAIPTQINYQGTLTNPDSGTPLDTTVIITFSLYDSPQPGAVALWTHAYSNVQVTDGLFHILLGSANEPLPDLFAGDRWLGIAVGQDAEMTPRQKIVSVAHAYRVGTVDGASGGTVSGELITDTLYADCLEFADETMQTTAWDSSGSANRDWIKSMGYLRGSNNVISETGFVGGGDYNMARGAYATISGGGGTSAADSNSATGEIATITGGARNIASGQWAVVSGYMNTASNGAAVVSGGYQNVANNVVTTIGGGCANTASGDFATVSGGWLNSANGTYAAVGGGGNNMARGRFSVISGGGGIDPADSNSASGAFSIIPGGTRNQAAGNYSFAGGRRAHAIEGGTFVWADSTNADFSSTAANQFLIRAGGGVGIGLNNPAEQLEVNGDVKADTFRADAGVRFPDGTFQNTVGVTGQQYADTSTWDATRAWVRSNGYLKGNNNYVDWLAVVGGGDYNKARGSYSVVSGGGGAIAQDSNSAIGSQSVIGGGSRNVARAGHGTIAGGSSNTLGEVFAAAIGGGSGNSASGAWSVIGGGYSNSSTNEAATVGGGRDNDATGQWSTVAGGYYNQATGIDAVVCGGESNVAGGADASLCGGWANSTSGDWSFVGGGYNNAGSGAYATVPGGSLNTASGRFSFAAGQRANAIHHGAFVWADSNASNFSSFGVNTFSVRAAGGVRVATTSAGNAGVKLDNGDTAWEVLSDSTQKTNRRAVNTSIILEKVCELPIEEWNYRHQDARNTHIGPMAQDFYQIFGYGDDDKTISTIDPDGIALAAIQELANQIAELRAENAAQQRQIQSLLANDGQTQLKMEK